MKGARPDTIEPVRTIISNYCRGSRWTLTFVVMIAFFSSATSIAAPYVFSRLINKLTGDIRFETIAVSFVVYALLLGFSDALNKIVNYLSFMSSESLSFIAATSFFERLLKKTVRFFIDHNPAEIQSAQSKGQQGLNIIVQLTLIVFIPSITQIILALLILGAAVSLDVVAIVLLYGTAFVAITYYANERTRIHLDAAMKATQENAKFVGNAVNAMETLRHFGSDRWMSQRFSDRARDIRDSWRKFCLRRIGYAGIYGMALAIEFVVTFALLIPRYRAGMLSVGDIVLFNTLLLQLNQPFEMIGHAIDDLIRSYSQFLPFARMWAAPEELEPAERRSFKLTSGQITFEEVGFAYEGSCGIEQVTFTAKRGRVTYLTGETGSGKTTLFKLALKSIEPMRGRICVDGLDLREIERRDWFSLIGVVPQEVMLLNDTIKTNIVLGRPLDDVRLRKAAKKAAIFDFIEALPEGFETSIGERGLNLSGGECQRIAIARALYTEPQILFLDEASSALDEATEEDIMTHIRAIADGVTVLAITHRRSGILPQDLLIQLIDGRAVVKIA
ncbi:MAG TPA: ABC transporter ATP-binding protein [Methylocella sp.]|nr:ABC transporter ATP-binding protein [Methylocella sp.]